VLLLVITNKRTRVGDSTTLVRPIGVVNYATVVAVLGISRLGVPRLLASIEMLVVVGSSMMILLRRTRFIRRGGAKLPGILIGVYPPLLERGCKINNPD
jgi:hypothetical protein